MQTRRVEFDEAQCVLEKAGSFLGQEFGDFVV